MTGNLTPEQIESMDFGTTMRGYDKDEVEAFLREVADEMRDLSRVADQKPFLSLGEEIGQLLQHARDAADTIKSDARREAAALVAEARAEAEEVERQARDRGREIHEDAEQGASNLIGEATAVVQRLHGTENEVRRRIRDLRVELEEIGARLTDVEAPDEDEGPVASSDQGEIDLGRADVLELGDQDAGQPRGRETATIEDDLDGETSPAPERRRDEDADGRTGEVRTDVPADESLVWLDDSETVRGREV